MTENDKTLLILNGVKYVLDIVHLQAKGGPTIAVKEDELNDGSNPEHVRSIVPSTAVVEENDIVFYKQHGKYTILCGQDRATAKRAAADYSGVLKGRLLSSVALKNAKLMPPQSEVVEAPAAPTYAPSFANKPRWQESSPRPSYPRTPRTY